MRIGVVALQGAFIEHEMMLKRLDVDCFEIRQKNDITRQFDGLIIPGGESTVMDKLLRELELFDPLDDLIANGLPVFGTCAGLILLAKRVIDNSVSCFGAIAMTVRRNAYGRQLGSFATVGEFSELGPLPMVFIRAPYIESVADSVKVLATVDGHIVAAKENNALATAFHPELSESTAIHRYFLKMIEDAPSKRPEAARSLNS